MKTLPKCSYCGWMEKSYKVDGEVSHETPALTGNCHLSDGLHKLLWGDGGLGTSYSPHIIGGGAELVPRVLYSDGPRGVYEETHSEWGNAV